MANVAQLVEPRFVVPVAVLLADLRFREIGRDEREELHVVAIFEHIDNRIEDVPIVENLYRFAPHVLNGDHRHIA